MRVTQQMGVFRQPLGKIMDRILNLLAVIAGLLLLFTAFSIGYSILARSLGYQAPIWVVQFNEYILLWIKFLAAAWVLQRGKHVSIDLLTSRLDRRQKISLEVVHSILGILVSTVLCLYGLAVTWGQFKRGITDVQAVDVPKGFILVIIPLGFFLLAVQFLRHLHQNRQALRERRDC
jgi:TRAP-type C4-dicarboxylate transport system permease small subunit